MHNRMVALCAGLAILVAACGAGTGVPSPAGGTATVPATPASTAPGNGPGSTFPSSTPPGDDPAPIAPGPTVPGDDPAPGEPTAPAGIEGPVFVDATDILYLESFPVQVRLVVQGSVPTPCHQTRWEVEDLGRAIDVRLWSEILLGQSCAQVLAPFEVSIPLGSFESASSPVLLNGEQVGWVSIGSEPAVGGGTLVGAGWSFGMCGGFCRADLAIDGTELVLTGRGWAGEEPLFQNRGVLTPTGLERLGAALARLGGTALDSVYGCPDCADGGAAHLVIEREGATSRHDMEFGKPPEELTELYGLAMAMIDALETCGSDDLVTVAADCEPWRL